MTSRENDLESESKKRSRPDFAERRKHNKEVAARVVKKKLTGVCRITTLECFIQRSVRGMTQMVVEASRLCNLHVLRRLEAGDPIEITSSKLLSECPVPRILEITARSTGRRSFLAGDIRESVSANQTSRPGVSVPRRGCVKR